MEQYSLTKREKEIVVFLLNSISLRNIGTKLHISINTVKTHVKNIKNKLNVNSIDMIVIKLLKENNLPDNIFYNYETVKCEITRREYDVLEGYINNLSTEEISKQLFITTSTVETHKKNIISKVKVNSILQVIILELRGLLEIKDRVNDIWGRTRPYRLTRREYQILEKLSKGLTAQELANELGLSPNSIETHKRNIFKKLGVKSKSEAAYKALNEGIFVHEIVREIEFDEEHLRAGVYILSHFGTVLKQKNPNNTSSVKIQQDGLKIKMTVERIKV